MNIRVDKKIFADQLLKIKSELPGCYAQFVKQYLPEVNITQIYSVNAGLSANWRILVVMAFIAKKKINIPENTPLDLPNNINISEVVEKYISIS